MIKKIIQKFKQQSSNNKIIIVNVFGAFVVRGLALIVAFFTTPAYIAYFNNDITLGLWFTILSVLSWILTFDFGIGNGLRNKLTHALVEKDNETAKRYVSSGYVATGALCFVATVIFLIASGFVNWNYVFNIDASIVSPKAVSLAVNITFAGIMVQFFLRTISSILFALQKSSINNAISLVTSVITLLAVLLTPSADNDTNIVYMAIVHALAVAVPLLIATLIVFLSKQGRRFFPSVKYFSFAHAKSVMSLGIVFFLVQIAYMLLTTTNEYFISFLSDPADVVPYRIYHQVFMLGSTTFSIALTPIWSVVTKACAEKNHLWISSLYKKLMLLLLAGVVCEFILVVFLQFGIDLWLGDKAIRVDYLYAVFFAVFGSITMFNSVMSSIANGLGRLMPQAITFTVGVLIKVVSAYFFVRWFDSWIGVMISNIIAMLPFCIVQPIALHKYLKTKIEGEK